MSNDATVALWAFIAVGFVTLSALYAAAESLLFVEGRERIEKRLAAGEQGAGTVLSGTRALQEELAAVQAAGLVTTLGLGVSLGRLGTAAAKALAGSLAAGWIAAIGLAGFVLAAFLHAALGVVLPRALGANRPPSWLAKAATALVRVSAPAVLPFVRLVERATRSLLGLAGRRPADSPKGLYPVEELGAILLRSHRYGILGAAQRELLHSIFNFRERSAKEVATPRSEMACVYASMRVSQALEAVRQFGFTRYPVCDGDKERVIGVVHFRDLVDAADADPKQWVTDVMDSVLHVPESAPASEVLKELQARRAHLAIVVGEHDQVVGMITLEDLLEEFFSPPRAGGDFPHIKAVAPDTFELDGSLIVEEVEDALGVELRHAGLETIGGYVFGRLGRKAQEGDTLKVNGVLFDVLEMRGPRITRLRAHKTREIPPDKVKA